MSGRKQLKRDGFGAILKPNFFTEPQRERIRGAIAKSSATGMEKTQGLTSLEFALYQLPTPWSPPLPSAVKGRSADMMRAAQKLHRAIKQAEDANKDIQRAVAVDTQQGTGRENELIIDIGQHLFVDDAFFSVEDWEAFKRVTAAFEARAKNIMAACDEAKKTTHAKRDSGC